MTSSLSRGLTVIAGLASAALLSACTVYESPRPHAVVEYREPPPTVYYEPAPPPPPPAGVTLGVHVH